MVAVQDIERSVLASALVNDGAATEIRALLSENHFYVEDHKKIFNTIAALIDQKIPVDIFSVKTVLHGQIGIDFHKFVLNSLPESHWRAHISRLRKAKFNRDIIKAATLIKEDPSEDKIQALLNVAAAWTKENSDEFFHFSKDILKYLEWLDQKHQKKTVFNTGFSALDDLLKGLCVGDLCTIAARPGGGKTILASTLAYNFAVSGTKVLVFTTEMNRYQWSDRIVPQRARVPAWKFRKGLFKEDWNKVTEACASIQQSQMPLVICDNPQPSIFDIILGARRIQPQVIVIDYLQRCRRPKSENVTRSTDEFMTQVKTMCLSEKVVGVLTCQMNRRVDHLSGAPTLSDLRDSGAIEAESDQVILLESESKFENPEIDVTAYVEKNRHGLTGCVELKIDKSLLGVKESTEPIIESNEQARLDLN